MRRETSTVVVLVGELDDGLLAELARSSNVSVVRAPAADSPVDGQPSAKQAGWEPGALAMREAARRQSTYVVVPDDPLAHVAARWRQMWDAPGGQQGAAGFEVAAAEALAAWRDKRFDLPDYYLIMAPAQVPGDRPHDHAQPDGRGADLYLGPLHTVRPRRVAVVGGAGVPAQAGLIVAAMRTLEHGPWWPPLDEVIDAARRFYPGGLAETQLVTP
jgi:hypothetical protein